MIADIYYPVHDKSLASQRVSERERHSYIYIVVARMRCNNTTIAAVAYNEVRFYLIM